MTDLAFDSTHTETMPEVHAMYGFEIPVTAVPQLTWGDPCFEVPLLDVDPARVGVQRECATAIWRYLGGGGELVEELVMPAACDLRDARDCWRVVEDAQASMGAHERFELPWTTQPAYDHHVVVRCVSR